MNTYYKDLGKLGITIGGDWNIESEYEKLVIVYDTESNTSYISKQTVPAGIELTNTDYWQVIIKNNASESESNFSLAVYDKGGLLNDDVIGLRLSTEKQAPFATISENSFIGRIKITKNRDEGGLLLSTGHPFEVTSDNRLALVVGTGIGIVSGMLQLAGGDNSPFDDNLRIKISTNESKKGLYIGSGLDIDENGALCVVF